MASFSSSSHDDSFFETRRTHHARACERLLATPDFTSVSRSSRSGRRRRVMTGTERCVKSAVSSPFHPPANLRYMERCNGSNGVSQAFVGYRPFAELAEVPDDPRNRAEIGDEEPHLLRPGVVVRRSENR